MGATQIRLSGQQVLWSAYRSAFREFEHEASRLSEIQANYASGPAEVEEALLRVEHARLSYNDSRDTLAAAMMPLELSRAFWEIPATPDGERIRVKGIAELLWELSGKPQGSADDDWYRAERVVRHTVAEACCAR